MHPVKTQLKMATITELGAKYDDMREAAEREVFRKEGYHVALNELQQSTVKSVLERVDLDRDAGRFDLPTAGFIKEYLVKVHAAVDNLRLMNERHRLIAEGRVVGIKDAITFAKKVHDQEKATLEGRAGQLGIGWIASEDSGSLPEVRPDAGRSALEDLDQRRAVAKAAREAAVSEPVVPVVEVKAVKATRGRPKGSKNAPKVARTS